MKKELESDDFSMNFRDRFYDKVEELGGFAEDKSVIDGGYEEFVAFNYCLAMDYYNAMKDEAFSELGLVDNSLIDDIMMWINYDGEINRDMIEEIKKIHTGMITTYKGRPFIEAVIENKHADFAYTFMVNGNRDIRLLLTYLLYGDEDRNDVISWYISYENYNDRESYIIEMKRIFNAIEDCCNGIQDNENKIKFLEIVKKNIQNIRFPKEFGKINTADIGNYNFVRQLLK